MFRSSLSAGEAGALVAKGEPAAASAATVDEIAEVKPQRPVQRARPVEKTRPTRRLRPGDLICGACGEGNPPTRKFCSRCGESLADAEPVRRRWWQRWLLRRGPKVLQAGARPGQDGRHGIGSVLRRLYRRAIAVVAVLGLILSVLYIVYPPLQNRIDGLIAPRVEAVKHRILAAIHPTYVPVHPTRVTGTAGLKGYPLAHAADGYSNTAWAVTWDRHHVPTLNLELGRKVDLTRLILTSGTSDNYNDHDRPATLHLVYPNRESDTVVVKDQGKPQTLDLKHAKGVTSLEIQITSIYQSQKGKDVAISEVELFAKQ